MTAIVNLDSGTRGIKDEARDTVRSRSSIVDSSSETLAFDGQHEDTAPSAPLPCLMYARKLALTFLHFILYIMMLADNSDRPRCCTLCEITDAFMYISSR